MNPTAEQVAAVKLFEGGESLAIEAGAGTGKTSTLKLLAEGSPRQGQYLAFNKAIVSEAKAKMPGNITANTAHSLAWRAVGNRYAHRLRSASRMRSTEIARILGIQEIEVSIDGNRKVLAAGFLGGLTMRGITHFCQSADPAPTAFHVPFVPGIDAPGSRENNRKVSAALVGPMRRAWTDLESTSGRLTFKHEHYLKLWQLSGPRIEADFILFDEAQDANPVMVAVVAAQTHAQLVWVGDSQQQIYTFTGAINALESIPADHRTFLTKSFRFGPEIARTANRVLDWLEADLRLEGNESLSSTLGAVEAPDAILTRTNAEAIRLTLQMQADGRRPHIVGGGSEVVAFAKAADDLRNGIRTSHPELACFDNWGEVQDYVDNDEQGAELKLLVDLVDEFGTSEIIAALGKMPTEDAADVVISTAHKSKGREWDSVQLAGDFNSTLSRRGDGDPRNASPDELRLLYVAVTRAKMRLDVTRIACLEEEAPAAAPAAPVDAADAITLYWFDDEDAEQGVKS